MTDAAYSRKIASGIVRLARKWLSSPRVVSRWGRRRTSQDGTTMKITFAWPLRRLLLQANMQGRWNCEAECPRRLEVDHQLVFRSLLDRQVGWFCPSQDFVDVPSGATVQFVIVCAVAHEDARFGHLSS